jgi:hypothetical protein
MVQSAAAVLATVFTRPLSTSDEYAKGIAALDRHWQEQRHSPVARWIRFYVLVCQADLLERMDRLEEALSASSRALSLPASPYARRLAIRTHTRILRRSGRADEAFEWALAGLKRCARARDVTVARNLIREVVRLDTPERLNDVAAAFPDLILKVAKLPDLQNVISPEVRTPLDVVKAIAHAMRAQLPPT